MNQHSKEEDGVPHGNDCIKPSGKTPGTSLDPVGSVVGFSRESPETRSEELVAVFGLDVSRILELCPRQLRESLSGFVLALLLHLEDRFLCHRAVKDVVAEHKSGEQGK